MTIQNSPYIRNQRNFPNDDTKTLSVEMDRAYIDIAGKINLRTVGIFPVNTPAITGESWYLQGSSQKQQTLRQVYPISSTAAINHGINVSQIAGFSKLYGQYTDGTNWYGLIAASNVAIAGQQTFYITPTQIIILTGGGAPAITSGFIILEWLAVF